MSVSSFLAYDQPALSCCGAHQGHLAHKQYELQAHKDGPDSHREPGTELSTIATVTCSGSHIQWPDSAQGSSDHCHSQWWTKRKQGPDSWKRRPVAQDINHCINAEILLPEVRLEVMRISLKCFLFEFVRTLFMQYFLKWESKELVQILFSILVFNNPPVYTWVI